MRGLFLAIGGLFTSLLGVLGGILKNLIWIGYAAVEALIFMWVFNYMAPKFPVWGWNFLPTDRLLYMESICLFLLIGFIGNWIKTLTPKFFSSSNTNNNNNSEE